MFKELRIKFIIISALSMFIVLGMVLFLVNIITYRNAISDVFTTLEFLSKHSDKYLDEKDILAFEKKEITPEIQYESRYITVTVDKNGKLINYNSEHIFAIDDSEIEEFINFATVTNSKRGIFVYDNLIYAFLKVPDSLNTTNITIMDCTRYLSNVEMFIRFSINVGVISMLLLILVISVFSRKAIQPMVNNIKAQKQFITNASHELKTPLAVISANTEVMEMMNGKNEWTESTINQVNKMSELISQLVVLSKLEEREDIVLTDVNISEEAKKVAESFKTVAETNGKKFESSIAEDIHVTAELKGVHELINILVDNAVKYCDDEGSIKMELVQKGKTALLTVSNDYSDGEGVDYKRFFDRFYREDQSHNSEKQGFGIGLSMADSLVRMFKGKISVNYKNKIISFVVALNT
ncbi:MAG: HAMP domain-containing histidine kinase [Eubacterium sp.]|nr:HAMP domain-containing histidine kinase [Eubacterium sp.]